MGSNAVLEFALSVIISRIVTRPPNYYWYGCYSIVEYVSKSYNTNDDHLFILPFHIHSFFIHIQSRVDDDDDDKNTTILNFTLLYFIA